MGNLSVDPAVFVSSKPRIAAERIRKRPAEGRPRVPAESGVASQASSLLAPYT
jgi:hypothetical protein